MMPVEENEASGHTDRLDWLPEDARRLIVQEAERKQPMAA
jgi:hypothetical protein